MSAVSIDPRILRQIDRIWLETAKLKGERGAERAAGRIIDLMIALRKQPLMGVSGSRKGKEARRVLAGDYWIYYHVLGGVARVGRLRHVRQDQSKDWDATLG